MIVISGALVLVALVLLVVGLTMEDLPFVYGSIGTSLLAFVFLVIGILQRRGEQAPAPAAEPAPVAAPAPSLEKTQPVPVPVGAPVDVSKRPAPVAAPVQPEPPEPEIETDEPDEQLLDSGGLVLVVAGRPRYHVGGCRYLNGKDVEEIDVLDARDEGFTPCGVCRPDEVIAAELEADRLEDEELQDRPAAEADDLAPSGRRDRVLFDDPSLEQDQPDVEPDPDPEPVTAPTAPARGGSRPLQVAGDRPVVPAAPAPSASPASAAAEAVAVGVVALAAAGVAASAGIKASRAAKAAKAPTRRPPAPAAVVAPAGPPVPVAPEAPGLSSAPVLPSPPVPAAAPVLPAAPVTPAAPGAPVVSAVPVLPVSRATGSRSSAARGAPGGAKVPSVPTPAVGGPAGSSAARSAAPPATAAKRGTVVVIPDRGRFHRAECRYVRDTAGVVELSRASATKQGYDACGVCKP